MYVLHISYLYRRQFLKFKSDILLSHKKNKKFNKCVKQSEIKNILFLDNKKRAFRPFYNILLPTGYQFQNNTDAKPPICLCILLKTPQSRPNAISLSDLYRRCTRSCTSLPKHWSAPNSLIHISAAIRRKSHQNSYIRIPPL